MLNTTPLNAAQLDPAQLNPEPHSPVPHVDVVIIGAGVAGLAAAHHLISAGVTVAVLEAAPRPGGRMATEQVDGFRLDRGGQLLSTAYPDLYTTPALKDVPLRMFAPRVLVHRDGAHHAARPPARPPACPAAHPAARPAKPRTPRSAPRALGTPRAPARAPHPALRPLAEGRLCVPAGGASTLPETLAGALPDGTLVTDVCVTDASITRVSTKEHGEFTCRSLLVATGARAAAELLPGLRVPDFHPVTVLHHTVPRASPATGPALVLDADGTGPVSHTAVMSSVDPSRAPRDRVLVSSTVFGPAGSALPPGELDRAVRAQLSRLYGTPTDDWEVLAVHHTPEAVPAMPAPYDPWRSVRLLDGLYVCGDHRDLNTVQGALSSARRAAHAVLRGLRAIP